MHLAALVATAAAAAALSVETTHVPLASGQRMQWLSCEPQNPKTHLVCVHGTFHGAWCFAERWLPRLAEKHGIAAHSISLRGTAGSPCVEKSITLSQHAADVAEAIDLQLPEKQLALCAHSFGGPVAIEALATDDSGGPALEPGSVVVVSGGARGVTASSVAKLAEKWKVKLALLGRSKLAEWPEGVPLTTDPVQITGALASSAKALGERVDFSAIQKQAQSLAGSAEVRMSLAELDARGIEAIYLTADVTSLEQVEAALDQVRET